MEVGHAPRPRGITDVQYGDALSEGNLSQLYSPSRLHGLMFDARAFRTWTHVLAGACLLAVLFFGVMVMAEEVLGDGARVTRTGLIMSAAAFVGYLGVAWLIRVEEARSR